MSETDMRIHDVQYDAQTRRYHGAVTFYEPNGIRIVSVSTAGQPAWGYARTLEALAQAAKAALSSDIRISKA